jgi:hypothetical protein
MHMLRQSLNLRLGPSRCRMNMAMFVPHEIQLINLQRDGLSSQPQEATDINDDGVVDGNDLAIVLAGWGGCA